MADATSGYRRERNMKSLAVGFVIVLIGYVDVTYDSGLLGGLLSARFTR